MLELLTVKELAKLLKISIRSIWRYRSMGAIPKPIKVGKSVRWDRKDIEQWLEDKKGVRNGN